MTNKLTENKEMEEKIVDILRAVHVHGVDGDFDGCDSPEKDPPSMSIQTALKKIKRLNNKSCKQFQSQTKKELEYSMSEYARFISKVKKTKTCWIWTGSLNRQGYGQFYFNHKQGRAHRYSFIHFKGEIPQDKVIDHICNNPQCVNPKHLRAVTNKENVLRGRSPLAENARKTHCPKGHPFDEKNTRLIKKGNNFERWCLECVKDRRKRWRKKNDDKLKAHNKKYRERHPDANRLWQKAHPEKMKEYERRRRLKNKLKQKVRNN